MIKRVPPTACLFVLISAASLAAQSPPDDPAFAAAPEQRLGQPFAGASYSNFATLHRPAFWFSNAFPAMHSRQPSLLIDRSGDRVAAEDVGTLAQPSAFGLFSDVNPFGMARTAAAPAAATGTGVDFFQNASLTASGNYSSNALPSSATDVRITTPSANNPLVITSASVVMESLSVANGSSYVIGNNTSGGTNRTLTLGNGAGFTNSFSGVGGDLIYLTGGSALVLQGPNLQSAQTSGTGTLGLVLASSGNFNVGPSSVLNISFLISGAGLGITFTNSGTTILGGANTYSGDTVINAGDLRFAPAGSSNNSTIRLGNTSGAAAATLTLGNGAAGGALLTSALEVRAGGTGTRVLRSFNTSGVNTYGGVITMNNGLTIEAGTNGTLLFQGGSFDLKGNKLTIDSQNDLNGSDNVNWRGTTIINEVLGSSQPTGGSLLKDGSGTLILQGTANTYTGTDATALNPSGTRIAGGLLGIYGDGSLGLAPAVVADNIFFVASSASNPTATHTLQDTANNVTLSANRGINIAAGVTGTLDSSTNVFTINGVISGPGALAVTGSTNGRVVLNGNNTYASGTTVRSGGTLLANNTAGSATGSGLVTVNNGGTLGGTGTISGPVQLDAGGTITPGATTATGATAVLNTGALTLASSSTYVADLLSTALGNYDQLSVTGTVDVTGSTLSLRVGGTLTANDKFFIVVNDSIDPVVGAFAQGTTITAGGYTFLINYADNFGGIGAGNDISLTVTAIPEAGTWIGAALAAAAIGWTRRGRFSRRGRVTV
jgi:autotransporter-associated beta strand protein